MLSTFSRLTTSSEQNNDSLQNFPTLGTRKCELKKIDESVSLQWNWASVNWKCCKERKSEIVILQLNFAEWNVGWCFVCAVPPFLITFPTTACTFEVRIAGDDNASRGLFHSSFPGFSTRVKVYHANDKIFSETVKIWAKLAKVACKKIFKFQLAISMMYIFEKTHLS